jgi:hypothetical protein
MRPALLCTELAGDGMLATADRSHLVDLRSHRISHSVHSATPPAQQVVKPTPPLGKQLPISAVMTGSRHKVASAGRYRQPCTTGKTHNQLVSPIRFDTLGLHHLSAT